MPRRPYGGEDSEKRESGKSKMTDRNQREEIAETLERHVVEEDEILQAYHVLSDRLPEGALSVLVNQIVTEEEMHHFLLHTLADWLRRRAQGTAAVSFDASIDCEAILRDARVLQDHETQTAASCRALAAGLDVSESPLVASLLEGVADDSEKHYRLLETLIRMLPKR